MFVQTMIDVEIKQLSEVQQKLASNITELTSRENHSLLQPIIDLGMSQRDIGKELSVSQFTISTWISGKKQITLAHVGDVLSRLLSLLVHTKSETVRSRVYSSISKWVGALEERKQLLSSLEDGVCPTFYT